MDIFLPRVLLYFVVYYLELSVICERSVSEILHICIVRNGFEFCWRRSEYSIYAVYCDFSLSSRFAMGLGAGSIPMAAALNWVLKDGLGQLGGMAFTAYNLL